MSVLKQEEIKKPIQKELKLFDKYFASSIKSNSPLLDVVTRFILRHKGKQMRPMFVFLTTKMLGEVQESTYVAATLIELLHTATLIHDDVVDESFERRSFFTINALWKSKVAVLTGDYLLAKGLLLTIENKNYDMLEIVSEAVKEMSEGELYQMQKARRLNINEENYFKIIRKKTASLFAACTACGARAVTTDANTITLMKTFGEAVGIAFQIKDDIFDYQNNGITGKPMGNDLREKKLTLPVIYALSNASPNEKHRILHAIKNVGKTRKNILSILNFVNDMKGIEYAEKKMSEYKDKALSVLNNFPDNPAKKSLQQMVEYTVVRHK